MKERNTFKEAAFELIAMRFILEADEETRIKFASLENTPPEILAKLANDESYDVCDSAIRNPNMPVKFIEEILEDEYADEEQLRSVADSLFTPVKIIEKLAKNDSWYVRYGVAENPRTPIEILKKFAEDEEEENSVREAAMENIASRPQKVHD